MGGSRVRSRLAVVAVVVIASAVLAACFPPPPPPPAGFQDTVVFQGLTEPTVVDFAPDGRVFVGEKSGLIKVFDSLSDTQPTVFAVRLGVVDPRVTTQVSWFIDCLVRWAPTLPSCEAGPWHPLDAVLKRSTGSFRFS